MPRAGDSIAVLVVGREPTLRETYAMLFQRAGYIADGVELDRSPARLKVQGFSILVMDHTLTREQRKSLVLVARNLSPGMKIVALHSSAHDCGADLVIDSREGPVEILARVGAMLESVPRKPSTGVAARSNPRAAKL